MKTNIQEITKPYIDSEFYTNIYKPNKNAMIEGSFNNVVAHQANFDSFVNRASEFIDRLVDGRVSKIGGIDYLTAYPQALVKKATAALVEWWFINGYNVGDLDANITIGSLSANQVLKEERFRKFIPLTVLTNLQLSGLWVDRAFAVSLQKELECAGIDPREILTITEAIQIFQQKGQYDDNFNIDIDFSSELTGQVGLDRWIKFIETDKDVITFELVSNDPNVIKQYITIDKDNIPTNSFAYQLKTNLGILDYGSVWVENNNGVISAYVKVEDNTTDTHLLITNIKADEKGEYKLLGSKTTDTGLTQIQQLNILEKADLTALQQEIAAIQPAIAQLEQDLTQILAAVSGITDLRADLDTLNNEIITIQNSLTSFGTVVGSNTSKISTNALDIDKLEARATTLEQNSLKKDGSVLVDSAFTPTATRHIVYKQYVDDAITAKLSANPSLSGFKAQWDGSQSVDQRPSGNTNRVETDLNVLVPQRGTFTFADKELIKITIETSNRESTFETRIDNDDKFDPVYIDYDPDIELQVQVNPNGIITFRGVNRQNGNEGQIPTDLVNIVHLEQVNGLVYGAAASVPTMDDTTIAELEGVSITTTTITTRSVAQPLTNGFTGKFATIQDESRFMAITDTVAEKQFQYDVDLKTITLPFVKTIGLKAFVNTPLTKVELAECETIGGAAFQMAPITELYIPKATDLGVYTFFTVPNAPTTKITMLKATHDDTAKMDQAFPSGYDQITFSLV